MKGTDHLEDIFTEASLLEHNGIFNPVTTGTQIKMCHKARWVDKNPVQQNQKTDVRTDMSGSSQSFDIGSEQPKTDHEKQSRWLEWRNKD